MQQTQALPASAPVGNHAPQKVAAYPVQTVNLTNGDMRLVPPAGSLCYCRCAQEAISTKRRKKMALVAVQLEPCGKPESLLHLCMKKQFYHQFR